MNVHGKLLSRAPGVLRAGFAHIRSSPIGYRLARGVFWSLAGSLISRSLGLVASIGVAQFLGQDGFGELGMIQSTVGLFGTFAGFGSGIIATRYVAEYRAIDQARAGRMMALSGLSAWVFGTTMTILCLALAPWLAVQVMGAPQLSDPLRIGSLLLVLGAVNGAQLGALSGFEAFKRIAHINLLAGLLNLPLMLVGAWLLGVTGAVWGLVAAQVANCVLSYLALHQETSAARVPRTYRGCLEEWQVLWSMGVPSTLGWTIISLCGWGSYAILVRSTDSFSDMGVLNATNQWRNALSVLPTILASALLPMLSACNQVQHGKDQQWRQLEATHGLIALGIWPLALGLASFAQEILSLYGSGFTSGRAIFIFILASMVVTTSQIPISNLIIARGWLWLGLGFNMLTSAILLITSYLLVPEYGGIGVALGMYVSQLIQIALLVPYLALRGELPRGFSLRLLAGMSSVTALMLVALAIDEQLANFLFVPLLMAVLTICYWSMSRWFRERLAGLLKPVANPLAQ